jgi:hypothetical protein
VPCVELRTIVIRYLCLALKSFIIILVFTSMPGCFSRRRGRYFIIADLLTALKNVHLLELFTRSRETLTYSGLLQIKHMGNLASREITNNRQDQALA